MKIGQLSQALLAEPAFRSEFANVRCNAPPRITLCEMFRSHSTAESDRLRRINLQIMNLLLINLYLYGVKYAMSNLPDKINEKRLVELP